MFRPDELCGYANREGAGYEYVWPGGSFMVAIDGDGLRVPAVRREGEAPVVFAGCSFTFGFGVPAEDTVPEQAGALLGVPVVNAGVSGYGLVAIGRRALALRRLRPRALVVLHHGEAVERSVNGFYPGWMPGYLSVPSVGWDGGRMVVREPDVDANREVLGIFDGLNCMGADPCWKAPSRVVPSDAEEHEVALEVYGMLKRMMGCPMHVVHVPAKHREAPPGLKCALAALGIGMVDASERVLGAADVRVPNDGHLNAKGNALVAEAVCELMG